MREYETVCIFQPDLSQAQIDAVISRATEIIRKYRGRLLVAKNMGKRNLAYAIRKHHKGIYMCLDYAAEGQAVTDMERSLRLDETVLRFLTMLRREDVDLEARAAEIIARGEDRPMEAEGDPARPPREEGKGGYPREGL